MAQMSKTTWSTRSRWILGWNFHHWILVDLEPSTPNGAVQIVQVLVIVYSGLSVLHSQRRWNWFHNFWPGVQGHGYMYIWSWISLTHRRNARSQHAFRCVLHMDSWWYPQGYIDCPNDWTKEYFGYLMSGHYVHLGASIFVCVDYMQPRVTAGKFRQQWWWPCISCRAHLQLAQIPLSSLRCPERAFLHVLCAPSENQQTVYGTCKSWCLSLQGVIVTRMNRCMVNSNFHAC